jgi:transposase-like protein
MPEVTTRTVPVESGRWTASRDAIVEMAEAGDKTRAQIARELEVPYQIVYQFTKGMDNIPKGQRGGASFGDPRNRTRVIVELPDGREMPRSEYIRMRIEQDGRSRGEVAEELGVPYQVIFAASKNMPIKNGRFHPGSVEKEETEEETETPRVNTRKVQPVQKASSKNGKKASTSKQATVELVEDDDEEVADEALFPDVDEDEDEATGEDLDLEDDED